MSKYRDTAAAAVYKRNLMLFWRHKNTTSEPMGISQSRRDTHSGLLADPEIDLPAERVRVVQVCLQHDVAVTLVEFAVDAFIDLLKEEVKLQKLKLQN